MNENEALGKSLQGIFGVTLQQDLTKAEIIDRLEAAITRLLQGRPDDFFQLMYRLDIPERLLQPSALDASDFVRQLAEAIYNRQLQKIQSRKVNPPPASDDEDLKW